MPELADRHWRRLWAKSDPFHPLWCHLLDAAAVCSALLSHFGGVEELPESWVCLLVGLHDLGKADPYFQNLDEDLAERLRASGVPLTAERRRYRHERRTAEWVLRWLRQDQGWPRDAARAADRALGMHHGNPGTDLCSLTAAEELFWGDCKARLAEMLRGVLKPPPLDAHPFEHCGSASLRLAGLTVLADWIASNPELFAYTSLNREAPPDEYFAEARALAAESAARLAFDSGVPFPPGPPPEFRDLFDFDRPRALQLTLEHRCRSNAVPPGLVIIEDQMGEGKSEAALYLLECWARQRGRHGAYLALPTAATSNQMHGRYRDYLQSLAPECAAPRLVHGMAWLVDDVGPDAPSRTYGDDPDEEQTARDWFRSTRRALLAPEGVGTIDQALMSVLQVRFGFLRFLGLATKALLVDEVHAYDEYMTVLLEQLLRWCRALRIPVVMLSATLSGRQKARLLRAFGAALPEEHADAYPLITAAPFDAPTVAHPVPPPADLEDCAPSRAVNIQVRPRFGLLEEPRGTAELAASLVQDGGCACVLVNTVKSAQQVYRQLARPGVCPPGTELLLFHARFRAVERTRREREVVGRFGKDAGTEGRPPRPARAILVATQVVEQSLDVDFDVLITELAPIDLVLQRCGRLHRHDRGDRGPHCVPTVHVLLPPAGVVTCGRTDRVYSDLEPLRRTLPLLAAPRELRLPGAFRELVGAVYDDGALPSGVVPEAVLADARAHRNADEQVARGKAQEHLLPDPDPRRNPFEAERPPVEEGEEGETASYFRARTRLGDDTRRVLVLAEGRAEHLLAREHPPRRRVLRWLMGNQAALPVWWLTPRPAPAYAPIGDGPKWLRGHRVLWLRAGEWRGTDANGRGVVIRDCPTLGLEIATDEEIDDDADV
jgi:CRISPR-associated endonuclease/helicase Cas3